MLTPAFNSTYTIRLATLLPEGPHDQAELTKSLQAIYDAETGLAGDFELELLGDFLVVTLGRSISDDIECNTLVEAGMTPITVQDQLVRELEFALQCLPEGSLGQTYELGVLIIQALRKHKATVAGLPCQMVKVRLVCEWALPAGISQDEMHRKLVYLASGLDGMLTIQGGEREKVEILVDLPGTEAGHIYRLLDLVKP